MRRNKAEKKESERKLLSKIPKLPSILNKDSVAKEEKQSDETEVSVTASEAFFVPSASTSTATEADLSDIGNVSETVISEISELPENAAVDFCEISETLAGGHLFSNDPLRRVA